MRRAKRRLTRLVAGEHSQAGECRVTVDEATRAQGTPAFSCSPAGLTKLSEMPAA